MRSVMPMLCVTLLAAVVLAGDPPPPAKSDKVVKKEDQAEEVRKKFYGFWLEIEETKAGVTTKDPEKLSGRGFSLEGVSGWPRRTTGELSRSYDRPGPRVVAADPPTPAKATQKVKEFTEPMGPCDVYRGIVGKIDANGLTLVEINEWFEPVLEHRIAPINVLRGGKILPVTFGMNAYRWDDVQVGDTVRLEVIKDKEDGILYCMEICISRRPKAKLPESQLAYKDDRFRYDSLFNDIENGEDVSDKLILKLYPPEPERKTPSGRVIPAHPGGLPKEWQEKLDIIRAKKKEGDLKATPPEKK